VPRYKHIDMSPRLLPVDLSAQIVPGSFEHALAQLIDSELDLSAFEARFRNDTTGATAYPPSVLLKIVLLAYSRGIMSSRAIEAACRQNVLFMAISGDTQPHFTTIAQFISTSAPAITQTFAQVLMVCDRAGLIGRKLFAIDGVKLPSNASRTKSGTRADFEREADKMERAVRQMLARHREGDRLADPDQAQAQNEARKLERLSREAAQLRQWLTAHPQDRRGGDRSRNCWCPSSTRSRHRCSPPWRWLPTRAITAKTTWRIWNAKASRPRSPTTATVSATRASRIRPATRTSPIRSTTRRPETINRSDSAPKTSPRPRTSRTASARRAGGCIATAITTI